MAVKEIKAYKTSDGAIHEKQADAEQVEIHIRLHADLQRAVDWMDETTKHSKMIVDGIMGESDRVYRVLKKYYTGS